MNRPFIAQTHRPKKYWCRQESTAMIPPSVVTPRMSPSPACNKLSDKDCRASKFCELKHTPGSSQCIVNVGALCLSLGAENCEANFENHGQLCHYDTGKCVPGSKPKTWKPTTPVCSNHKTRLSCQSEPFCHFQRHKCSVNYHKFCPALGPRCDTKMCTISDNMCKAHK